MGLRRRGKAAGMQAKKAGARQKKARGKLKKLFQQMPEEGQALMKTGMQAVKSGDHATAASTFTTLASTLSSKGHNGAAARIQMLAARAIRKTQGDDAALAAAETAVGFAAQAKNKKAMAVGIAKVVSTMHKGGHTAHAKQLKKTAEAALGMPLPAKRVRPQQ